MMLLALTVFSIPAMAQLTEEVRSEGVFYFNKFKKEEK